MDIPLISPTVETLLNEKESLFQSVSSNVGTILRLVDMT